MLQHTLPKAKPGCALFSLPQQVLRTSRAFAFAGSRHPSTRRSNRKKLTSFFSRTQEIFVCNTNKTNSYSVFLQKRTHRRVTRLWHGGCINNCSFFESFVLWVLLERHCLSCGKNFMDHDCARTGGISIIVSS